MANKGYETCDFNMFWTKISFAHKQKEAHKQNTQAYKKLP